jgi:hypothetical protein
MAITYPITLPAQAVKTSAVSIKQKSVVGVGVSPYTLEQQTQVHQGQCWVMDIEWPAQSRDIMDPLITAFISLNGREGTFLMGDPSSTTPKGIATGTPLVKGASQTGYDLVTDGWTINKTGIMKAGDWIQLGTASTARLYKVMVDANSNASGEATLTLWPKLRSSPADNAALTINSPVSNWRLTTDGADWNVNVIKFFGLKVSAQEAL